jgi:SAM-dependent methyltransferase
MRAAVVLLRAAGAGSEIRWHLRRLEPYATHERYQRPGKSTAYAHRSPARGRRELQMLALVWPGQHGDTVIDSPCGAGRLWPFLRDRGHEVTAIDRARAMLTTAGGGTAHRINADALRLPIATRAVAGVVVFRFLHHLPTELARAVVAEAARVADRWIVVTVFRPWSLHALWRRLATTLRGRARTRFAHAPARVAGWLAAAGYQPHASADEGPGRELCVLSFCRNRE